MNMSEWLDARTPAAPDRLRARTHAALGDQAHVGAADAPDACVVAAERLLEALLPQGCDTREGALDLLAADALATYAFEAAADTPELLDARAAAAMQRFAATVTRTA